MSEATILHGMAQYDRCRADELIVGEFAGEDECGYAGTVVSVELQPEGDLRIVFDPDIGPLYVTPDWEFYR